jgi:5-methylthioadenosine/S-adenosylhomocysteine deaminase
VTKLLAANVNVCIGTDSSASNNCLDMMAELKLAAILAKGFSGDTTSVPAATVGATVQRVCRHCGLSDIKLSLWLARVSQALRMATLNGAKALGIAHLVGTLEVGKQADIIAVKLDEVELAPMYNVISHIVYASGREKYGNTSGGLCVCLPGVFTTLLSRVVVVSASRTCGWTVGGSCRSVACSPSTSRRLSRYRAPRAVACRCLCCTHSRCACGSCAGCA